MVVCHGALASVEEICFKKEIHPWSKNKKNMPLSKDRLNILCQVYYTTVVLPGIAFLKEDFKRSLHFLVSASLVCKRSHDFSVKFQLESFTIPVGFTPKAPGCVLSEC